MNMKELFGMVGAMNKAAEDPEFGKGIVSLGAAAAAFPKQMEMIILGLRLLVQQSAKQDTVRQEQHDEILQVLNAAISSFDGFMDKLDAMHGALTEISLGLDAVMDPVKRPPFHATDVQAAMKGEWPPRNDDDDHYNPLRDRIGEAMERGENFAATVVYSHPPTLNDELRCGAPFSDSEMGKMQAGAPSPIDGRR